MVDKKSNNIIKVLNIYTSTVLTYSLLTYENIFPFKYLKLKKGDINFNKYISPLTENLIITYTQILCLLFIFFDLFKNS